MTDQISWLMPKKIKNIKDYQRFRNTKAYLKKKSGSLKFFKDQTDEIKKLAESCGYKKFNKFVEHRKEWHDLTRKIPLVYLKQIEAKLDVIEFTVELDQKEFKQTLEFDFSPKSFTVRGMPGAYFNKKLPVV